MYGKRDKRVMEKIESVKMKGTNGGKGNRIRRRREKLMKDGRKQNEMRR